MARKQKVDMAQIEAEKCVSMSNALTRAAHGLTLAEKRLLMLGISKLNSKAPPTPENMVVTVTAVEFANEYKVSMNTAYDELQSAGKQLFLRYISFYWNNDKNLSQMHWVGRATYITSEGKIELAFWHELAPQLFQLNELFTSYKLSRTAALRSIYSWRVFELLMQFKNTGWLKISVDDFCDSIEAPATFRSNFANLRIRVIEPALKEIKETDGLPVTWEPVKAGRKVKSLTFRFPVEHQTLLPIDNPEPIRLERPNTPPDKANQKKDDRAELTHLQMMSDLSGVPLQTLLPKRMKEVNKQTR